MSDDTGNDFDLGAYDPRRANGLIAVSLPDQLMAAEFLMAVRRIAAQRALQLRDAVLVVKNDDESVVVQETIDPTPGRSALSGGLWGGLLGLLFGGPIGWAVGLGVGGGVGAGTAKLVDLGIPDEWVAWFREAVQPGTTTVVLLLEDLDIGALANEMTRFPFARLVHTTLPEDAMRRLEAALGGA